MIIMRYNVQLRWKCGGWVHAGRSRDHLQDAQQHTGDGNVPVFLRESAQTRHDAPRDDADA